MDRIWLTGTAVSPAPAVGRRDQEMVKKVNKLATTYAVDFALQTGQPFTKVKAEYLSRYWELHRRCEAKRRKRTVTEEAERFEACSTGGGSQGKGGSQSFEALAREELRNLVAARKAKEEDGTMAKEVERDAALHAQMRVLVHEKRLALREAKEADDRKLEPVRKAKEADRKAEAERIAQAVEEGDRVWKKLYPGITHEEFVRRMNRGERLDTVIEEAEETVQGQGKAQERPSASTRDKAKDKDAKDRDKAKDKEAQGTGKAKRKHRGVLKEAKDKAKDKAKRSRIGKYSEESHDEVISISS